MNSQPARTLRDYDQWAASLRNYEWLQHVAPGGTDLDLLIERRGRFLVLECKRWFPQGIKVPLGQHIALRALAALEPFTVYLVGEVPDDEYDNFRVVPYSLHAPLERGSSVLFPPAVFRSTDDDGMRQLVRTWIEGC